MKRNYPLKRIFDVVFSIAVLSFGAPLYLLIMCLVALTSKGSIFYASLRMGRKGRLIKCWKFRTMCVDADRKLHQLLESDPHLRLEWETFFKLKKDPRLTPIGSFLRKSSLDELPQFWNVLIGDLSLVGPRPIAIDYPEKAGEEIRKHFGDKTDKILSATPGLTCLWQLHGRNHLTFQERILLEEKYVDTQSFWLDLKIILRTIVILLFPKGAF